MFIFSKISNLIESKQNSKSGIRVQDMAIEMGIPLSTLNNIKNGLAIPGVDKLEVIARYFGVDMNYFFDMEEKKTVQTEHVKIIDGNEYILNRFEQVVSENAILKLKLEAYESAQGTSYSLPDVPNLKVAEKPVELKKK